LNGLLLHSELKDALEFFNGLVKEKTASSVHYARLIETIMRRADQEESNKLKELISGYVKSGGKLEKRVVSNVVDYYLEHEQLDSVLDFMSSIKKDQFDGIDDDTLTLLERRVNETRDVKKEEIFNRMINRLDIN